jgi:hypothetical protein
MDVIAEPARTTSSTLERLEGALTAQRRFVVRLPMTLLR